MFGDFGVMILLHDVYLLFFGFYYWFFVFLFI